MLGLVLTAGGARGAYQAGVLKRIGELSTRHKGVSPFAIIAGASAGAINGSMVAGGGRLANSTTALADLWASLDVDKVIRTDALSLAQTGLTLARDLSLGGLLGGGTAQAFFDASPLHGLLREKLPLGGIATAIRRGELFAIAISATSYHSGRAFTFIQGRPGHPVWVKSRRVCIPVTLTADHILASASIPLLFPPVLVRQEGECYFGDGGLRLVTPFSPAIRLGARRLLAIGVRCSTAADALSQVELGVSQGWNQERPTLRVPPMAQICGVFLNAIFLDHLDADLDHLLRMNELIASYEKTHTRHPTSHVDGVREPMRIIEPLMVSPSEDLALVARQFEHRMPTAIRYILDGLGKPNAESADLMSYLLFDSAYTSALVDIGYSDAERQLGAIEALLYGAEVPTKQTSARAPKRVETAAPAKAKRTRRS